MGDLDRSVASITMLHSSWDGSLISLLKWTRIRYLRVYYSCPVKHDEILPLLFMPQFMVVVSLFGCTNSIPSQHVWHSMLVVCSSQSLAETDHCCLCNSVLIFSFPWKTEALFNQRFVANKAKLFLSVPTKWSQFDPSCSVCNCSLGNK